MPGTNFCPNCFAQGFCGQCSQCGYSALSQASSHMILPPGIYLNNRYLLGRTLGAGGFGITYLVQDQQTGALRAVKEYLPSMLAMRNGTSLQVTASSGENQEIFLHGLKVFHREAEVLRLFAGNPSIVQVYDYFEAYGTAYYVMEFLDGVNLKALMASMGGRVPTDMAASILDNLAGILQGVHQQGLLHRDISPENIFITRQGHTKLIDFGATRHYVGERSQSLTVILKPGFAPPEQYSSRGNQGPWTDLYALCATFYCMVCGQTPPDAPDRLAGAMLTPLRQAAPDLSPSLAAAVEEGLHLDWRERIQDMEALRKQALTALEGPKAPPPVQAPVPIRGSPFVQSVLQGVPKDKWAIPKNINISIGRAAEQCNIILDLPNVSRVHCSLRYDDKAGVFYLTDQSTNGTLVEGGRLARGQVHALQAGEIFYITSRENGMKVGLE